MYRVLIIATYDSFLKSGVKLAQRINHSNIDLCLYPVKRKQVSERQLMESQSQCYAKVEYHTLNRENYKRYDIIILSVGNMAFQKIVESYYRYFSPLDHDRPLILSIFPGVIFGHTDSILARLKSDLILANSKADLDRINKLSTIYNTNTTSFNYGLININEQLRMAYSKKIENGIKNIVFIDQVKYPESKNERVFILSKIIYLAINNPDKKFFIKTRLAGNKETTIHLDKYPYKELYYELIGETPHLKEVNNFFFTDESLETLFPKIDLCMSISSTVLLEALYYGIPSLVIGNIGVKEKYAMHHFIDSGIIHPMDNILKNPLSNLNQDWFEDNIDFPLNRNEILHLEIKKVMHNIKNMVYSKNDCLPEIDLSSPKKNILFRKFRKLINNPKGFLVDAYLKLKKENDIRCDRK
ncbi:hypothetical protein A4G20_02095 [Pasteurellaceae bacterium RH1A]|nr:hypothetical protein A4G20_02095 [Pasteurellaceae bacterium RH1A]